MPEFAHDLGHAIPTSYSMLLAADAAGALFADSCSKPVSCRQAATALLLRCCGVAPSPACRLEVLRARARILFAVGFLELSSMPCANAGAAARAGADSRSRDRLYILFALGMRAFSGITIAWWADSSHPLVARLSAVLLLAVTAHCSRSRCARRPT